ncbi:outer membrane protein [Neolewinella persica]|uniref:outer membrane protein n=1 Tax=Neolewinella persica TaxID=70998 RepID=UPI00037FC785|nr:outer membrane beta-barrel protein [Neolewinella persica]
MKSIITLFLILFTLALSAQNQKGNWYLDGSTSAGYGRSVGRSSFNLSGFSATTSRAGYFFTDRLLIGTGVRFVSLGGQGGFQGETNLQLRPFARYYFLGGDQRKVNFFGEFGFGTFNLFSGREGFETDFNLGGGAEISLLPGVLGTLNLRYDANASGLNFTTLAFGFNVLTGQLENTGGAVSLREGTITTRGRLGAISYGRMSSNGLVDQSTVINLMPWIGFFLSDRLMLEGGLDISYGSSSREIGGFNQGRTTFSGASAGANINLRYYLKKEGTFFPYLMAGGGFIFNNNRFSNDFGESNESSQTVPLRLGAGASYFLSPNLALDVEFAYNRSDQISQFQIASELSNSRIGLGVGFRFFLPKG